MQKNPNGYCPDLSTGIVFSTKQKDFLDNSNLLLGKQILILDAQSYCPYCEKLKIDVVDGLEEEIIKLGKTFSLKNTKQNENLIEGLKKICRKYAKEKTGKKPITNINVIRI